MATDPIPPLVEDIIDFIFDGKTRGGDEIRAVVLDKVRAVCDAEYRRGVHDGEIHCLQAVHNTLMTLMMEFQDG